MARTIGARTNSGFLARGRHWSSTPELGHADLRPQLERQRAGLLGQRDRRPPLGNVPPAHGDGLANHDPHSDPRSTYLARVQKGLFLQPDGVVVDVCKGKPCLGRPLGPEDPPKR